MRGFQTFSDRDLLLQLGFVEQAGIAGKDGDILRKVHPAFFVDTALVDAAYVEFTVLHL
jgi:hypothetical protein